MATRAETATRVTAATRRAGPRRRRIPWGAIVMHGVLCSTCVVILFPLFWVLLLSVKSLPDAYTNHIWPNDFEFGSYRTALTAIDTLPQNIRNSIVLTLATMGITTTGSQAPCWNFETATMISTMKVIVAPNPLTVARRFHPGSGRAGE